MKTKNEIPQEVQEAFEKWMRANLWRSTLTRSEIGRLGAAKRGLLAAMRKHGLGFDEVAQAMV